ncbi:MAG: nucleoside monophosphate kinase [Candidatus Uhrbacteria bacterium]
MYKILMIGPQGSGKGTQAELLSEHLNIPTIAMGRLLRQEVKKGSDLGKEIDKYIDEGKLVPDEITDKLIRQWMQENYSSQGWILDGFPRRMHQLEQLLEFEQPTHAVLINLDDETAVDRLSARRTCFECGKVYHLKFNPPEVEGKCECGGELKHRDDDQTKAIRERLKIYHSDTEDLIERYRTMGILVEVDGRPGIKEVKESIIKKL